MSAIIGNDFYDDLDLRYVEVAILMEDIPLPPLPMRAPVVNHSYVRLDKTRVEELYTDTIGKFCIPILFPLEDKPVDTPVPAPTIRNIQSNTTLVTKGYMESNYVEINIPKYIMMNFLTVIPKGTRFLIIFVGGGLSVSDIRIIGVKDYVKPETE